MSKKDEIATLIEDNCTTADGGLHRDRLIELARVNGLDHERYAEDVHKPYQGGRIRMAIGNALRGKLRRGEAVYDVNRRGVFPARATEDTD